jgi:hypothetical protein
MHIGPSLLRRGFLFALACAATLLLIHPAHARPPQDAPSAELDLPSYEAELDRCAEALKQPDEIPQIRKSLPHTWVVRAGDSRIEVPTDWLTTGLWHVEQHPGNSKATVRDLAVRLAAMRKAATDLENAAGEEDHGPTARARLEQILRRREFANASGPSQAELLMARIGQWIIERLVWLFTRLHLSASTGNFLAWAVVALAFLVLCYWVWQSLARAFRSVEAPAVKAPAPETARLWAKDALAAAERGDYREAVHCAYWAAVTHLEGMGLLKRDRARTPRESLRLLEPHPAEQTLLRDFTQRFELIWYGYRPASADDWSGARAHLEKMGCLTASTAATASS